MRLEARTSCTARTGCLNDRRMIAVDTSALMAIALGEAEADACIKVLESEPELLMSAGVLWRKRSLSLGAEMYRRRC